MKQKLIDQLIHKAGARFGGDGINYDLFVPSKFAELIVAECTAVLFDESERLSGLYSEEDNWNSAEEYEIQSTQCVDDIALIEKHFGVEE